MPRFLRAYEWRVLQELLQRLRIRACRSPRRQSFLVPALRAVTKTNTGVAVLIADEQRPRAADPLERPCWLAVRH